MGMNGSAPVRAGRVYIGVAADLPSLNAWLFGVVSPLRPRANGEQSCSPRLALKRTAKSMTGQFGRLTKSSACCRVHAVPPRRALRGAGPRRRLAGMPLDRSRSSPRAGTCGGAVATSARASTPADARAPPGVAPAGLVILAADDQQGFGARTLVAGAGNAHDLQPSGTHIARKRPPDVRCRHGGRLALRPGRARRPGLQERSFRCLLPRAGERASGRGA